MKTSKSIACISYNTPAYLEQVLKSLVDSKVIDAWCWIFHHKEVDETKDHIHLFMNPTRLLQTADLVPLFKEPDLKHPENKPLGIVFKTNAHSEWVDWYLYGLHDKAYLLQHGFQARHYHYQPEDMHPCDPDWFELQKNEIVQRESGLAGTMKSHISRGGNFSELVLAGLISPNNYSNQKLMFEDLALGFRRTGLAHDPITGEISESEEDNSNDDTQTN